MVTTALLANSVDRLYMVLWPIYYFANRRKIVILLMLIAFAIPVICIIAATIAELTKPPRMVARACLQVVSLTCTKLITRRILKNGKIGNDVLILLLLVGDYCFEEILFDRS